MTLTAVDTVAGSWERWGSKQTEKQRRDSTAEGGGRGEEQRGLTTHTHTHTHKHMHTHTQRNRADRKEGRSSDPGIQ